MKTLVLIMLSLSSVSSFAGNVCELKMHQRLKELRRGLVISEAATVPFFFLGGPVMGGVQVAIMGVGNAVESAKPRFMLKLIRDAKACSGKKVERLYDRYVSETRAPIAIENFCGKILASSEDGSLCPDHLPTKTKKQILTFLEL